LSGAAADFEDLILGFQPGKIDDIGKKRIGIERAGSIVEAGDAIECEPLFQVASPVADRSRQPFF